MKLLTKFYCRLLVICTSNGRCLYPHHEDSSRLLNSNAYDKINSYVDPSSGSNRSHPSSRVAIAKPYVARHKNRPRLPTQHKLLTHLFWRFLSLSSFCLHPSSLSPSPSSISLSIFHPPSPSSILHLHPQTPQSRVLEHAIIANHTNTSISISRHLSTRTHARLPISHTCPAAHLPLYLALCSVFVEQTETVCQPTTAARTSAIIHESSQVILQPCCSPCRLRSLQLMALIPFSTASSAETPAGSSVTAFSRALEQLCFACDLVSMSKHDSNGQRHSHKIRPSADLSSYL